MGVRNFFNKIVYVQRMRDVGGYITSYSTTATADASIQKLDSEHAQSLGITDARGWCAYFEEDEDVKIGDYIVDKDTGTKYLVKEITKVDWGINTHLEVMLEEYSD